jgi:hypothetical protein
VLAAAEDAATFYVGAAAIELYRTETDHYRSNLDSGAPSVWIALRPTGAEPPYALFAVTADPAEGESFTQAGDDLVEAVPMPSAVREIVRLEGLPQGRRVCGRPSRRRASHGSSG